ncbi:MAG: nicotinate-nucleotide adenylyltransferase [Blastocatellia bacterium]|nr:nicotinate-nucleotide adenylyltransferase [Blastocatellia bacterium]
MRIGILGGTFDPIHYGHLRLGESLFSVFNFDELLYVPAFSPPHKTFQNITPAYHRYAMTVLATLQRERVRVSTLELAAPEKPYSVETVARLREEYGPSAELFFLMGADSFLSLHSWYRHQELIDACHIVVMSRPGYEIGEIEQQVLRLGKGSIVDWRAGQHAGAHLEEVIQPGTRIFLTDFVAMDVSATEIRAAVSAGKSIARFVPALVERYIYIYKLYLD